MNRSSSIGRTIKKQVIEFVFILVKFPSIVSRKPESYLENRQARNSVNTPLESPYACMYIHIHTNGLWYITWPQAESDEIYPQLPEACIARNPVSVNNRNWLAATILHLFDGHSEESASTSRMKLLSTHTETSLTISSSVSTCQVPHLVIISRCETQFEKYQDSHYCICSSHDIHLSQVWLEPIFVELNNHPTQKDPFTWHRCSKIRSCF